MSKDEIFKMRLSAQEKRMIREEAEDAGLTMAEYIRTVIASRPDQLLSFASGDKKVPISWIRYVMQVATEECDSLQRKSGKANSFEWSESCNALIAWLKENPYHPDGPEKVRSLFGNLPDDMRAVIFGHVDRFVGVR